MLKLIVLIDLVKPAPELLNSRATNVKEINKRTANMLFDICLTDHLVILDQRLQVSFCEDLVYDEKLSENERLKIEEAYTKSEEDALYDKGWEIVEKKLL